MDSLDLYIYIRAARSGGGVHILLIPFWSAGDFKEHVDTCASYSLVHNKESSQVGLVKLLAVASLYNELEIILVIDSWTIETGLATSNSACFLLFLFSFYAYLISRFPC
ncbi:hypothetical protein ACJX0J_014037, partial [Zea mays]